MFALTVLSSFAFGCSDDPAQDAPETTRSGRKKPKPTEPQPMAAEEDPPSAEQLAEDAKACEERSAGCLDNQQVCVAQPEPHCAPCPVGQFASREDGACVPLAGTPLTHEFSEFTVQPNEEVLGLCQSWTLNNAEELWVNAVELEQDSQSHHSNWLFAPSDQFDGPDGVWLCASRGYSQLRAASVGGVLYAQSTQAKHEVQKFPAGAAVRIPPYSRIIGDVHLLNVTDKAATGRVTLSLYTLEAGEVEKKLAPFHLTYNTLDIPPQQTSRFFGECDIDQVMRQMVGKPLDIQVYFILPHTHALGSRYFVEVFGGPNDGESLIDIRGFNGEGRGRYYAPPVDMTGAKGFRFGCEFDNPRNEVVHWGFGDQEMCENLGFVESDIAFEASVDAVNSAGMDGDIPVFTGPCSTLAFRYGQDRPGGPGPSPSME